jgi:hypothetical protein
VPVAASPTLPAKRSAGSVVWALLSLPRAPASACRAAPAPRRATKGASTVLFALLASINWARVVSAAFLAHLVRTSTALEQCSVQLVSWARLSRRCTSPTATRACLASTLQSHHCPTALHVRPASSATRLEPLPAISASQERPPPPTGSLHAHHAWQARSKLPQARQFACHAQLDPRPC